MIGARRRPATPLEDHPVRFADPGPLMARVTEALRDAIVAGRLQPGARIRERELVGLLGISRSPLREAIRVLEGEGFITSLPHRGSWVSLLTEEDHRETNEVRIMLETFAARLALRRDDPGVVPALERRLEAARRAGARLPGEDDFALALGFHDVVVQASGNSKVIQLFEVLKGHLRRYHHVAVSWLGRDQQAIGEHAALVEAFKRRDPAEFEQVLTAHLRRASAEIARLLPPTATLGGAPFPTRPGGADGDAPAAPDSRPPAP